MSWVTVALVWAGAIAMWMPLFVTWRNKRRRKRREAREAFDRDLAASEAERWRRA